MYKIKREKRISLSLNGQPIGFTFINFREEKKTPVDRSISIVFQDGRVTKIINKERRSSNVRKAS